MKHTTSSPTARVLAFLRGTTRREASCWTHEAKRVKRCQPVKPCWRIRDQGQDAEPGTDGHILTLCTIFNQGRHAGTCSYFHRQQAMLWTRGGKRRSCPIGLRIQGRHREASEMLLYSRQLRV